MTLPQCTPPTPEQQAHVLVLEILEYWVSRRAVVSYFPLVQELGEDDCWDWMGHVDKTGYGHIHVNVAAKGWDKTFLAHRVAYFIHYGTLPSPPLVVRHLCGNRLCCNPNHLAEGTAQDNANDSVLLGTVARGDTHGFRKHPEAWLRGSQNKNSRLTEEDVIAIRALYDQGWSYGRLAARFSVNKSTIARIVRRQTWQHIP
jgi:HNH endonuclease/Helix-turn-helix domain